MGRSLGLPLEMVAFQGKLWALGTTLDSITVANPNYVPSNVLATSSDGVTWSDPAVAPIPGRWDCGVAVFKEKLWLVGGGFGGEPSTRRDAWSTADGIAWNQETASIPFEVNSGTAASFAGKIWVLGGGLVNKNQSIYFSSDGKIWDAPPLANAQAILPRIGHSLTEFGGMLWMIGGAGGADVSYSPDGLN